LEKVAAHGEARPDQSCKWAVIEESVTAVSS